MVPVPDLKKSPNHTILFSNKIAVLNQMASYVEIAIDTIINRSGIDGDDNLLLLVFPFGSDI